MPFRLGDRVKVVKYKFPHLNIYKKIPANHSGPVRTHHGGYELIPENIIGLIGEIVDIRSTPTTEYEKKTGEIQKYKVRAINSRYHGWKPGNTRHFWEEELVAMK